FFDQCGLESPNSGNIISNLGSSEFSNF
ncbi:unnamed protein product, partial [Allacma fusca]